MKKIVILAIVFMLCGTAYAAIPPTDSGVTTICFDKRDWDARDKNRPCARITNVWEDGSLAIAVYDADGDMRYRASVGAKDR